MKVSVERQTCDATANAFWLSVGVFSLAETKWAILKKISQDLEGGLTLELRSGEDVEVLVFFVFRDWAGLARIHPLVYRWRSDGLRGERRRAGLWGGVLMTGVYLEWL
ncbi:hypothetical protein K435DRAFT_793131 [Dendrothele bispora CBS 962.96]|uniref:Uncharacterized protein n=1 Tax=Dendrothele bispora (strain CBS 962.96) TaxID=1314807 RepID=A0A4S8MGP5_DENBC|nr:hypothetical protein K435DRAFT_793131 [Dendrothele bispora CBS 962.96]